MISRSLLMPVADDFSHPRTTKSHCQATLALEPVMDRAADPARDHFRAIWTRPIDSGCMVGRAED